jgi:hypothetical protein
MYEKRDRNRRGHEGTKTSKKILEWEKKKKTRKTKRLIGIGGVARGNVVLLLLLLCSVCA